MFKSSLGHQTTPNMTAPESGAVMFGVYSNSMQTKNDYSYGVIPVMRARNRWEVFVLQQISYRHRDDLYWTFPKGHPEEEETKKQTALRELDEETSISLESLDTSRTFDQKYTFIHKDTQIEKSVLYYVGYAKDKNFVIEPDEVAEGRWCTFAEARELLTHDIAKQLLDEVAVYLGNK
ncbi:MAG: bis(5'-nucleosidyl)-tetraphosphatase [Acidimicrobiales bacterium]|jgi:bis(5'-nucleosidyl)-tetraphosphatase